MWAFIKSAEMAKVHKYKAEMARQVREAGKCQNQECARMLTELSETVTLMLRRVRRLARLNARRRRETLRRKTLCRVKFTLQAQGKMEQRARLKRRMLISRRGERALKETQRGAK